MAQQSTDARTVALDAIKQELERQLALGFPPAETDALIAVSLAYLGRAVKFSVRNQREGCDCRENLIKAAATILAALEQENG